MNLRKKFSGQFILLYIFIGILGISMISGFVFQVQKLSEYKQEISSLTKEIQSIKKETEKIKKVNGDTNLEDMARSRLNMLKQGEIIYVDIKGGD